MSGLTIDEIHFKLMFEGINFTYRDFVPEGVLWADIIDD